MFLFPWDGREGVGGDGGGGCEDVDGRDLLYIVSFMLDWLVGGLFSGRGGNAKGSFQTATSAVYSPGPVIMKEWRDEGPV